MGRHPPFHNSISRIHFPDWLAKNSDDSSSLSTAPSATRGGIQPVPDFRLQRLVRQPPLLYLVSRIHIMRIQTLPKIRLEQRANTTATKSGSTPIGPRNTQTTRFHGLARQIGPRNTQTTQEMARLSGFSRRLQSGRARRLSPRRSCAHISRPRTRLLIDQL